MVSIIWRQTQHIKSENWDPLEDMEKKFLAAEKRIGFPVETKTRHRALFGSNGVNTLVIDYKWESMAKMEKVITKALLDPEYQKLSDQVYPLIEDSKWEIFVQWPAFPK
ncbi:MAG: hypothetical protein EU533_02180 [Promethearchaeota archaeon]|nr:MAG: hypothetical protein EU533_02180 [Candidatus Lokiarchaeota archaeon]